MKEEKRPENPFVNAYGFGTDSYERSQEGISLRDHYAGLAMQTILKHKLEKGMTTERGFAEAMVTEVSYLVADAMLKQREL